MTWLIAGLGNPGLKYRKTRHNAGFMAAEEIADRLGARFCKKKFSGAVAEGAADGQKVILLKPHTYMNLSGDAVLEAAQFYKIPPERIVVVYDDVDVAPGRGRVRAAGSAGSHNGMRSILARLGTQGFPRVRIGIGRQPQGWALADYVLAKMNAQELAALSQGVDYAAAAALAIVTDGVERAQQLFNGAGKGEQA